MGRTIQASGTTTAPAGEGTTPRPTTRERRGRRVDARRPRLTKSLPSVDVRILIVGSGAREHALARALSSDPSVRDVIVAPGNPGTAAIATNVPVDVLAPAEVADRKSTRLNSS